MPESSPLAPRDLLILATLAESANHGYGLIKRVEARSDSGVRLDPANLYRVLRRMRANGWIEEVSAQGQDPGRRRTYRITETGSEVLTLELERLDRLVRQARPAIAANSDHSR